MSSLTILFFALFLTAAIASPLAARDTPPGCHPNSAGSALTLSTMSGSVSWSAKAVVGNPLSASTSPLKFFFQQNGFPIVDYMVKTVESTNFALELNGGAPLIGNIDLSGSNVNQKWMVDCTFCTQNNISQEKNKVVAKRCSITSTTNMLCVTSLNSPMTLVACTSSGDELFDITAVPV
ncbi:hypothetical protein ARMGADRAFT_1026159 [Armillaria gallica]|uniref:Ricin B lectin domain-containing protein n=1 Tax=Armillaria gallica TaxID=47427 RepID=A0A2H3DVX8_ARMGA|nr:hypothetical protein ARMGADRAFT_1026159 [Armillaria gallica]